MEQSTASAGMNQYEKGKHAPDYQTMQRIAQELGYPVTTSTVMTNCLQELILHDGKAVRGETTSCYSSCLSPEYAESRDSAE